MVALLLVEYGQQKQSVRRWPFLRLDNNNLIQVYSFVKKVSYVKYQQISAVPSTPGYWGAFARLVSPEGEAFANFSLHGGWAFANPGATPSFWHARSFLSEYKYKGNFTGKTSRLAAPICQGRETIEEGCKGMWLILCMHFFIAFQASWITW